VIKVWDVVTGEQRKTIDGVTKDLKFTKEVTSIRYVDGSNEFLVASGDNQVGRLREDGESVRTFAGATDFIQSAGITPDGKVVLGGSQDGVLRVWNGTNGESSTPLASENGCSNKLAATWKSRNNQRRWNHWSVSTTEGSAVNIKTKTKYYGEEIHSMSCLQCCGPLRKLSVIRCARRQRGVMCASVFSTRCSLTNVARPADMLGRARGRRLDARRRETPHHL
jgi:WD40 repeat protein